MTENTEETRGRKMELLMGLLIAVFAAVLAINDLGAGRYGDDEKMANDHAAEMYSWFQSKSIKQSLLKGQKELLTTLEQAKAVNSTYKTAIDSHLVKMKIEVERYEMEKNEIQRGSKAIGKENWVIKDADGKMGTTIGAEEWKLVANTLGEAGGKFDLGTLFLQLCLVLGAIGLVIQVESTRKIFLALMISLGLLGAYFTMQAYTMAWSV